MKKILLTASFILASFVGVQAQGLENNALGIRLGDGDGFGTEISYQRLLSSKNRLEIDLGIESGKNFDGFKATGIYQWVWNIDGGFHWYAGPGAGVGTVDFDNDNDRFRNDNSETFLFVAGQVGIEYDFDIPIQLSLDVRPEFYFGDLRDGSDFNIALGIRYKW